MEERKGVAKPSALFILSPRQAEQTAIPKGENDETPVLDLNPHSDRGHPRGHGWTPPSLAAATYTMTDRGGLVALFVPDGMNAFVAGLEGAQAQLLDNGVFTIKSPSLPPITGKWSASLDPDTPGTSFWAKTDQITLRAYPSRAGNDGFRAQIASRSGLLG